MPEMPRRDFLKIATASLLAAGGLVGLGMLGRILGHAGGKPRQTRFDIGAAADHPPGTRTLLAGIPALLVHAEDGFSAISLACTHLGCTVEAVQEGFTCPCHGSRYDLQGRLLQGPAKDDLRRLRVEQDENDHVVVWIEEE